MVNMRMAKKLGMTWCVGGRRVGVGWVAGCVKFCQNRETLTWQVGMCYYYTTINDFWVCLKMGNLLPCFWHVNGENDDKP